MKKFIALRAKTYVYLKDNNDEGKKTKFTKICVIKRFKFKYYKSCLKTSWIANIINSLEREEIDLDCLKQDKKSS